MSEKKLEKVVLEPEKRQLMFAKDVAMTNFNRARGIYNKDLQNQSNPDKEQIKKEDFLRHFTTMCDAAEVSSAAEIALAEYDAAHAPPKSEQVPALVHVAPNGDMHAGLPTECKVCSASKDEATAAPKLQSVPPPADPAPAATQAAEAT